MGTHNATRVQQLIQECLDSLKQFSVSLHQAGGSGTDPQQAEQVSGTLPAPRAAEKNTSDGETPPPSKMKLSQDWSENVTDIVTTNTASKDLGKPNIYALDPIGLLHEEFLMRKARLEEDEQWIELYKQKLDSLSSGAEHFTLNGHEVATYKRNGNLNTKRLGEEHPEIISKYTRLVTELKFDKESFGNDEPELFHQYRAKVFRLSGARSIKTK